jgi:DNA-directed RNA polymerase specialized sigma24 family protein
MRRRLVAYFERKRCLAADDLADETLHRVARRLEEQGSIADTPPAKYCYVTARFVFLEQVRQHDVARSSVADQQLSRLPERATGSDPPAQETLLNCLDDCLEQLGTAERGLILEYYQGHRASKIAHRRQLAQRLQISANALTIRASRIRDKLEGCVKRCSERR